jgi:nitroreductase
MNRETYMLNSLLEKRRSIRKYRPEPVEPEKIDQLLEAALRAPSSRGFNPWEFIVIDEPRLLEQLSTAKPHGASFLKRAPLGIVVCADRDKSDVWVEDAAIASILIHLAAASLGLGSCWIQIRKRMHDDHTSAGAYVREILHMPDNLAVAAIIAVGYPDETKKSHDSRSLQKEKVYLNRFGNRYPSRI